MLLNSKHELALHLAICRNNTDFLDAFIQFDRKLLEVKIMKNEDSTVAGFGQDEGQSLLHYAIICNSDNAIEYLVDQDNNCVNELCNYGTVCQASVIHLAYAAHVMKTRNKEEEDELQYRLVREVKPTVGNIKLFLEHCSTDILITKKSGSVLFQLIKLGAVDLIETIFNDRFKDETEFLEKFANMKDKNGNPPIFAALKNLSNSYKSAALVKLLIAHKANVEDVVLDMIREAADLKLLQVLSDSGIKTQDQMAELVIIIISLNYYLALLESLFSKVIKDLKKITKNYGKITGLIVIWN